MLVTLEQMEYLVDMGERMEIKMHVAGMNIAQPVVDTRFKWGDLISDWIIFHYQIAQLSAAADLHGTTVTPDMLPTMPPLVYTVDELQPTLFEEA